jgi:hypothetical protein
MTIWIDVILLTPLIAAKFFSAKFNSRRKNNGSCSGSTQGKRLRGVEKSV